MDIFRCGNFDNMGSTLHLDQDILGTKVDEVLINVLINFDDWYYCSFCGNISLADSLAFLFLV